MLIYLLIDLIVIVVGFGAYQKTGKKWALGLLFCLLVFFCGLRGSFTTDYRSYADYFLKIRNGVAWAEILSFRRGFSMERGFVLLCKLIGCLSSSPVFFFTVIGAATVAMYFFGIQKLSAMPVLSVLLFISVGDYYASYNLVRQILATALVFWGMSYFIEKKKLPFSACAIVAVLIHRTALVVFPLALLLNCKLSKKNLLIFGLSGVGVFALLPYIVQYTQRIFSSYSSYSYGMGEGTINAAIPQIGMLAFVAYSILLGNCDFDVDDRKNRMLINGAVFATILQLLGLRIYIVSRLAYYFKPFFWILIPNIIANYKEEWERRVVLVAISLFGIAFTWVTLSGTGYEPYYFFFQMR